LLYEGHRFTGKNLEVALPAIILFDGESKSVTDPFLIGSNTFVQVRFKIVGDSLSGVDVNARNLSLYPSSKAQISVEREIIADENDYIIWNSMSEAVRYSVG